MRDYEILGIVIIGLMYGYLIASHMYWIFLK